MVRMATKKNKNQTAFAIFCLFILFVGVIMGVVYLTMFRGKTDQVSVILMWATIGAVVLGTILTIIWVMIYGFRNTSDDDDKKEVSITVSDSVKNTSRARSQQSDESESKASSQVAPTQTYVVDNSGVTQVSGESQYNFVSVGNRQPIEEKFQEISKMDKTQFVIYAARLFSNKGYQVQLTPVMDNHDIDLLVDRNGETVAVGCILTNDVLSQSNIAFIKEGSAYYRANSTMVLTNTSFDKSAHAYAKDNNIILVDRDVLTNDYMS